MQHRVGTARLAQGRAVLVQLLGGLLLAASLLPATAAEPIPVRTAALEELLTQTVHSAPATVVARNDARLAAEIDARIVAIEAEVGDKVGPGQVLARLDCRRHDSLLAAARAALERAKAQERFALEQLERARDLRRNKSVSEELVDQRATELAVARAEVAATTETLNQAGIDVAGCRVPAPFDGVVTARLASVGDYAQRGTPLLGLLETDGLEVSAELRLDQVGSLEAADDPRFETAGSAYPLRLRSVVEQADSQARTREARLSLDGPGPVAGTPGRLIWTGARNLLGADLLVRRDGTLGVFLVDAGSARFVALSDAEEGRPAAVDLSPDSRVVVEGRHRLIDGAPVTESQGP
jgi:RND family efflux transporter MFP subunit